MVTAALWTFNQITRKKNTNQIWEETAELAYSILNGISRFLLEKGTAVPSIREKV